MATVYVSYRSTEEPFVKQVVTKLQSAHDIRIDYEVPKGANWRDHQLDELRTSEVFLVFVSEDTRQSDFQNAEMGDARFCQRYIDGKLIIPALIDDAEPPRPLAHLKCLNVKRRDPATAAQQIEQEIAGRAPRVRLFISHAHLDAEIASRLVDVITANFHVPDGELRCTSVPGHQLDLGVDAPTVLRRELGSAACVLALLTPNSLSNDWVLFELGAAWMIANTRIPLLAGGLLDKDLPGALRGAVGGQLGAPGTLDRMLAQLRRELSWPERTGLAASGKCHDFVRFIASKSSHDFPGSDLLASFNAKRHRIGAKQGLLLDQIAKEAKRAYVPVEELCRKSSIDASELHYRLEQLRLLGFLKPVGGDPISGWTLSDKYRQEIGL